VLVKQPPSVIHCIFASPPIRWRISVKTDIVIKKGDSGLPRGCISFGNKRKSSSRPRSLMSIVPKEPAHQATRHPRALLLWGAGTFKGCSNRQGHHYFLPSSLLSISLSLRPRCSGCAPVGLPSISWTFMPLLPLADEPAELG